MIRRPDMRIPALAARLAPVLILGCGTLVAVDEPHPMEGGLNGVGGAGGAPEPAPDAPERDEGVDVTAEPAQPETGGDGDADGGFAIGDGDANGDGE